MALDPPSWVAAVAACFRHQLRLLFHSRLTLVFQLAFLIALPVAVFLVGDFFAADQASLDLMLGFLPWIALIFTPALAMKAFVGRGLDREREFLLTLPLSPGAIVAGTWLAGSAVLLATLAFTAPFAVTVAWLGEPDFGAMAGGYVGAACLLVSFYAVGLFASSVARSEIGAFVTAVLILFVLLMAGWDGLARLSPGDALSAGMKFAIYASPKFWMEQIATGRVALRAIAYFGIVSALALVGATVALEGRPRLGRGAAVGLTVAAAACALFMLSPARIALDLTEQRIFTLSEGTLALARKAPPGSRIDFFWSENGAEIPSAIRAYAGQVADLLKRIAASSDGRLAFQEHDAEPDENTETPALAAGLRRTPLSSGDAFFLGASFSAGDRHIPIAYFDQRREGLLEYDAAVALAGLTGKTAKKIGVMTPLLAPGDPTASDVGFNAISELRKAYDVAVVPPFADKLPDGLDALVVIDATFLKREMLYSIDQSVLRGMGLVVMLDPRLRLSPASDRASPTPSDDVNDISDLLLRYGARYDGDEVVGDAALATPIADAAQKTLLFPYWMRFDRNRVSQDHAATSGLGDLLFVEPGSFAAAPSAALVTTTEAAGAVPSRTLSTKTPAAAAADFAPGGGQRMIAAELDGPFDSAFTSAPGDGVAYLARSARPAAAFAVADVDWILDPFAYEPRTDGGGPLKPRNDNVALFLNMVERAAGGGELIAVRSRGQSRRPLTRVAEVARKASEKNRGAETAAMSRISEVEKRIAELPGAAGVAGADQLPPDIRRRVTELRDALAPDRRILRDARRRARGAIERLRFEAIVLNLAGGPALALGFAALIALGRRRRRRL